MTDKVYNLLFLCSGNPARSIMAEVLLNRLGQGRFRAFSAGSHPAGQVHPLALEQLERAPLSTEGLRSKVWIEFARPGARPLDFAFTDCDKAAREVSPEWQELNSPDGPRDPYMRSTSPPSSKSPSIWSSRSVTTRRKAAPFSRDQCRAFTVSRSSR